MSRLTSATSDQRGMVLPLTLMFVIILTTLSVALLTVGGHETLVAANHLKGVHALFLAEAGLEDAFNTFRNNTTLLTTSVSSSLTTLSVSGPGSTLSAYGGYTVQYQSAGLNTVRVVVTGYTGTSGSQTATRVLRSIITVGFNNSDAVRTDKDLKISGNPTITGTCGSVHTNDDLTINGGPTVTGTATASDDYDVGNSATVAAGSGGDKAKKVIPTISASDFLTKAKATVSASQLYQFFSDGKVKDGSDTLITTLSNNDTYRGWKYKTSPSANWEFSADTAYDGTYYFQGDVKISGNPGSVLAPWNVTIIATGDIEMSGNPNMNVHSLDTLLVSDDDIKVSGNPIMYESGAIIAKDSVEISGNPTIMGYILSGGDDNKISGNPTITYNCGLAPPITADVTILASGF